MSIKIYLLSVVQALVTLGPSSSPSPQTPLGGLTSAAPIVDLGYSQYQGSVNTSSNITNFLGVRYAAAPTGNLRWEPPQSPPTTSGVQQATTQPIGCYAGSMGMGPNQAPGSTPLSDEYSEDCLFLNVHVPGSNVVAAPSGGLPVVVWIHGGGYAAGGAAAYDGGDLIKESNYGVIVVVMQYRLGVFGFLAGQAVKQGGALNAGLLDQDYALQWVQSHISTFGGDPARVTLWGESAGGGSVLQQLVANAGNTQPPRFQAAITSSPFLPSQYNYHDAKPETLYSTVVNRTNCNSATDTLACLRATDVGLLQAVNYAMSLESMYGTFTFTPVVDGTFIVERPSVTIGKGRLNAQRLLAVHNTNEGVIFVNPVGLPPLADYLAALFPSFGSSQAVSAALMYQGLGNNLDQARLAIGEAMFICPAYYLVEAFGAQSWKAEFAIPLAWHIDDVPYYFTSYAGPPLRNYNNAAFIQSFSNSFMAYAMYGTPNHRYNAGDITPAWNPWQSGLSEIVFGRTPLGLPNVVASTTNSGLADRCSFWRSVSGYTLQ
ncbi:alpha/beta-hydrolase [Rhizopogon vinicolor AM-OR11-026]|uniref:Carboxylic ester hydrolase n=1 Tax=Rhizopogon vinicolor AM-OR11-026 TaxID=1314800 RepID=A0A1B7MQA8_9AGAM|nr:alpha/beta-hydrolase [Rhizopogon vinicolor AM-OR11-026]